MPIIIGEVAITHIEDEETQVPKVEKFFKTARECGVPCLWWEDYFVVEENTHLWLYDKNAQTWGRPKILKVIHYTDGEKEYKSVKIIREDGSKTVLKREESDFAEKYEKIYRELLDTYTVEELKNPEKGIVSVEEVKATETEKPKRGRKPKKTDEE